MISLGNTQIHNYTKEQSRTFCFGWCLLCGCMFLSVFLHAQTANPRMHRYRPFFGWRTIPIVPKRINSLTAIRVLAGTKNSRPVGFYSRNSTKSTLNHKHNNPQHYHHGGAVCPSYGVGSMDPPDRTRVTSSEGVGRGGGKSDLTKSLN